MVAESSFRRAWKDSESFRKDSPLWYWVTVVLGALASGAVGGWVGSTIGGVVGVCLGLGGVFILILCWNVFRAPYMQRDEALHRVDYLESELEKPKLFDVVCQTTSIGLPINRLNDGSYRASTVAIGFNPILIAHRGELTNVTGLTASPTIRFTQVDNQGWRTTNAIQVTPGHNPFANLHAMGFTWDTSNPQQWVLAGLPLAMAKDELLQLPMMMLSVTDANEAGARFASGETCTLIVRLAVRTDKGAPALPDQVITLTRSDAFAQLGIQERPDQSNGEPTQ